MRIADLSSGPFPRRVAWGGSALVGAVVLFASGFALATHQASGSLERNAMIESKGAQVMPFDQNRTTHISRRPATAASNQLLPMMHGTSSRSP
jgi:hypothetical protein